MDARERSLTRKVIEPYRPRIKEMLRTNTVTTVHQRLRDEQGLSVGISSFRRYCWVALSNRSGRAAVGETDLDHYLRVVCDKQVAESITVLTGKRHPLEVTVGSDALRADLGERAPHMLDGRQKVTVNRHCRSLAEQAIACQIRQSPADPCLGAGLTARSCSRDLEQGTRSCVSSRVRDQLGCTRTWRHHESSQGMRQSTLTVTPSSISSSAPMSNGVRSAKPRSAIGGRWVGLAESDRRVSCWRRARMAAPESACAISLLHPSSYQIHRLRAHHRSSLRASSFDHGGCSVGEPPGQLHGFSGVSFGERSGVVLGWGLE